MSKLLCIALLLTALIQTIQAFCVQHNMTDGISVYVTTVERKDVPIARRFKKSLNFQGAKECCNYSNRDCSPDGTTTALNHYEFRFHYNRHKHAAYNSVAHRATCYSGGLLVFYGNRTGAWLRCDHPYAVSEYQYPNRIVIS
ncbi:hypothetical protein BDB01DRAFT_893628 [Pilobolus umbonatus]|nr:hypothetical protein BDB01DRAFT_893628 [Pilobolus umbonatus]